jgi:hypothetical protein
VTAPSYLSAAAKTVWDRLDHSTDSEAQRFDPSRLDDLPSPVARWLSHTIVPDAPLRSSARLSMHGEIKVGRWMSFAAQQILTPDGFIWAAQAGRLPLRIRGYDRFSAGTGEMRWKIARVVPVMAATGPDTTRSAAGRLAGETMLLPGAALGESVTWHENDDHHATATVTTGSFTHQVTVGIDNEGRLRTVTLPRWGNPDKKPHHEHVFGVEMSNERSFGGYLIPATLRAGWWYGSDRWSDGEFYRAELRHAQLY